LPAIRLYLPVVQCSRACLLTAAARTCLKKKSEVAKKQEIPEISGQIQTDLIF
jgi:hypothetical protein